MKKLTSLALAVSLASAGFIAPVLTAHATDASSLVATASETPQQRVEWLLTAYPVSAAEQAKIRELAAKLPANMYQRMAKLDARLGIGDSQFAAIAGSAINPADYQCGSTPVSDWLMSSISTWTVGEQLVAALLQLGMLPAYDALVFGSESKANTFGVNGDYTALLTSEMKDLRRFWDFDGSDIQLIPMHGADVFKDVNRLARAIEIVWGASPADALVLAGFIKPIVDTAPGYQGGAHPYFSFNAFAYDGTEASLPGVSKRIIMGDGVLQGYAATGFDPKVAPRSILAHEYGHQVQFAKGTYPSPLPLPAPEATRRTELMADAYATYFMVHSQGEALNATRTLADQKTFYNVGDCGFDADSHHGTPNQRFKAAGWAVGVVNSAANQGHKLGGVAFDTLFEAKLPELVAPDAP